MNARAGGPPPVSEHLLQVRVTCTVHTDHNYLPAESVVSLNTRSREYYLLNDSVICHTYYQDRIHEWERCADAEVCGTCLQVASQIDLRFR